ncbi:GNAT family N-acetyltransferase [Phaeobacter sp. HF9A]|uniref:GNAT family N-acetyltransferase n=1 Tax=Phaeobacter sp. HF9A TaxID=2721561 RepID=UPI00142F5A51|nr:N-acetyltransferase [Phaeobacter sp. HF9A]NIZ12467.1 GNAT family N-acetyltransferase [Phaeobacter sp. HF9A]
MTRLRTATPSDASSLAALSIEVWIGTYLRQGISGQFADYVLSTFTRQRFLDLLHAPDEQLIVSQNRSGIDGYIRLTRNQGNPVTAAAGCEISTLYVQPRHQGTGIGRALLDAGLAQARRWEQETAWLTTNSENTAAIGFYLAQGFERIGTTAFMLGNDAYPNDVFNYQLAP